MTASDNKPKGYGYFERDFFPYPYLNIQPVMKINSIRNNRKTFLTTKHCTRMVLIPYSYMLLNRKYKNQIPTSIMRYNLNIKL